MALARQLLLQPANACLRRNDATTLRSPQIRIKLLFEDEASRHALRTCHAHLKTRQTQTHVNVPLPKRPPCPPRSVPEQASHAHPRHIIESNRRNALLPHTARSCNGV
eukprot:6209650-Pleurochrysis_carterae.AAC.1